MFVNNFKINLNTISGETTATTINIPINMQYQLVDQAELVDRVFVDVETEKAINPIIDYEKVRFTPLDLNGNYLHGIYYNVYMYINNTYVNNYGAIGFTNDDIKFQTEAFKQSFINLNFYDSDNPLVQNLVNNITLYPRLTVDNLFPASSVNGIPGQPLPATAITLTFKIESPLFVPDKVSEGFYLYDYKDELAVNESKYLYMRASFNNAKIGTSTNLMVKNSPQPIDKLVHELYTRYKLTRKDDGYYYEIDNTYQGNSGVTGTNNVIYVNRNKIVRVNLYQIRAL